MSDNTPPFPQPQPQDAKKPTWGQTLRVYLEPATLRMLFLGFSAGLPLLLVSKGVEQRRAWLLLAQAIVMASVVGMALADPREVLQATIWCALAVAFGSAAQDLALDALRIESAQSEDLAWHHWHIGPSLPTSHPSMSVTATKPAQPRPLVLFTVPARRRHV